MIQEAISSFAEDASIQVFSFLKQAGASQLELNKIQQAWTRVHLSSQAFGRKGTPIDPITFSRIYTRNVIRGCCA
jgi:hypothetical protein